MRKAVRQQYEDADGIAQHRAEPFRLMPDASSARTVRSVRVSRPYGGKIIIDAPDLPGVDAFFARVKAWLESQPQVMALLPDYVDTPEQQEIAQLRDAAETWDLNDDERDVWLRSAIVYETTRRPPVEDEKFRTQIGIERRSVSSFVIHRESLYDTERGVGYTHEESTHFAEVEMRPSKSTQLPVVRAEAARLSAVHEDVLDLLISNAEHNKPDENGLFTIEVDAILNARGTAKKKKDNYSAGHHTEARIAVVKTIRDLDRLFVATAPLTHRHRRVRNWDRVMWVSRYTTLDSHDSSDPDLVDPRSVVAVQYGFGTWIKNALPIQAPRALLALDAQREGTAKDVGRYFIQRAHEVDPLNRITRPVRQVFMELDMRPELQNPQRSRNRLEKALDKLVAEKVVSGWGYVEGEIERLLPPRGWLEHWLALRLWVQL